MKKIVIFALAATAMLESSLVMVGDQLVQALLKGLKKSGNVPLALALGDRL